MWWSSIALITWKGHLVLYSKSQALVLKWCIFIYHTIFCCLSGSGLQGQETKHRCQGASKPACPGPVSGPPPSQWDMPRTCWRDDISHLDWKCLGAPHLWGGAPRRRHHDQLPKPPQLAFILSALFYTADWCSVCDGHYCRTSPSVSLPLSSSFSHELDSQLF